MGDAGGGRRTASARRALGAGDLDRVDVEQRRAQGEDEARPPRPARARRRQALQPAAADAPLHLDAAGPDPRVDRGRAGAGVGAGDRPRSTLDLRSRVDGVEADSRVSGSQVDAGVGRARAPATSPMSARTSSARPPSSAWMKLACLVDTAAVPCRRPLPPAASMRRPAESPGGLVNTEPAFGPPGWLARRQAHDLGELGAAPLGVAGARGPGSAASTSWCGLRPTERR